MILAHPNDNVLTAIQDLPPRAEIESGVLARMLIPAGHKVARRPIPAGAMVTKGGAAIGAALAAIAPGDLVHAHNVGSISPDAVTPQQGSAALRDPAFFDGYLRADGRVATRNVLGVFVVGNCAATVARQTADWFDEERIADFPNVDGVAAFVHEIGCGMEMTGEPMDLLRRTIAGFIRHPNTAGAVVLALGCERNNLKTFLEREQLALGDRLHALTMQERGGTLRTVEEARRLIQAMLPEANRARRQKLPAAHLSVGLQSSGADGFSGLSANPALGVAVDLLVAQGGTAILSETPELSFLGEGLVGRSADGATADALQERLVWWTQSYARGRDVEIDGRLNPASRAAGLATVREKALDSLRKAGSTPLRAVYRYADLVTSNGLVFMDTPSHDPVSVTGQIAGGANLIACATGRGAFGSFPAPTLTIASNSAVFARAEGDIDLNAGAVIDGEVSIEEMGLRIFEAILAHASGAKTRSEVEGMGEDEFVPWPIGVLN